MFVLEEIVPLWSLVFHCHLALHLYQAPQVPLEKHDLVPASSEESLSPFGPFFLRKFQVSRRQVQRGNSPILALIPLCQNHSDRLGKGAWGLWERHMLYRLALNPQHCLILRPEFHQKHTFPVLVTSISCFSNSTDTFASSVKSSLGLLWYLVPRGKSNKQLLEGPEEFDLGWYTATSALVLNVDL